MTSSPILPVVLFFIIVSCIVPHNDARYLKEKRSGISDHRLAELETLLALSKMNGKMITVPVAFGVIDPEQIGKRTQVTPGYLGDSDFEDSRFQSRFNPRTGNRQDPYLIWKTIPSARININSESSEQSEDV